MTFRQEEGEARDSFRDYRTENGSMLGSGKGEVMVGARWAGKEQGFTGRVPMPDRLGPE